MKVKLVGCLSPEEEFYHYIIFLLSAKQRGFFCCLLHEDNKNKADIRVVLLGQNVPELQRLVQALVMY